MDPQQLRNLLKSSLGDRERTVLTYKTKSTMSPKPVMKPSVLPPAYISESTCKHPYCCHKQDPFFPSSLSALPQILQPLLSDSLLSPHPFYLLRLFLSLSASPEQESFSLYITNLSATTFLLSFYTSPVL